MTGVFISYSRKDSVTARKLMSEFKSINLDVWVDWEDIPPAVGWLDQIMLGIEQADVFVFLVSPDSIVSEVCKVEVLHAQKNSKRIIPILVRDVRANDALPNIRELNWIYLREQDDFAAGLEKVKVAIDLDLDWLLEHRRLQVRALEWDRRKDSSLLLRGRDLRNARRMIATAGSKDPKPSELHSVYIKQSTAAERFRTVIWISAVTAILIMIFLSLTALNQRQKALANERQALANEAEAVKQKDIAREQEKLAKDNAHAALAQKAIALENEIIAKAQRSAARAQIFQTRAGGLFTSTLLAIDSWTRQPSDEAEEILRTNISFLPDPVSQTKQGNEITTLEISPNGLTFASGSDDGKLCVNRFRDGGVLFCVISPGSVRDAVFDPEGELLVSSDETGEIMILDVSSGEILKQTNYGVSVLDVNISPNGRSLAIARDDGRITFINLSTYVFESEFSVYGSLQVTAFSPDGEWFAAGSNLGALTFWNLSDGEIVSGGVHRGAVFDIAFSPDSSRLLSGGEDNLAIMTRVETGDQFLRIINEDWVEDVAFSPDGSWFVTASDDYRIRVWDTETGEERLRLLQDSLISEVKVSPDGQWIATTGLDKTVHVWSAADGAEAYRIPLGGEGNLLEFSLDGAHLVVGDTNGVVSTWSISELKTADGYLQFPGYISNLELSPDEDWIAASVDDQVWLLDPDLYDTQTVILDDPDMDFRGDYVHDLAPSPDGNKLAITTLEGRVVLYTPATQTPETLTRTGPVQKVIFTPDGSSLVLGGQDGLVQLRALDSKETVTLLQIDTAVYSLAVSPDTLLAVGGLNKIWVIDLESKQVISEMESSSNNETLAFEPDGAMLVSNTSAGYTYVWLKDGDQFILQTGIAAEPATSMAFNSNNERLYVGEEGLVTVLDPMTGVEAYRIRHKGAVTSILFSQDWDILITASLKTLRFFDISDLTGIPEEEIADVACGQLTQNFSETEWVSFFEDEPYRKLCESLPIP